MQYRDPAPKLRKFRSVFMSEMLLGDSGQIKLRTHGGNAVRLFHPPLWTEFICILTKDVLVSMDNPGICANARLHNISTHNTH